MSSLQNCLLRRQRALIARSLCFSSQRVSAASRVGRVTRRSRGFWLVVEVRVWNYLGVGTIWQIAFASLHFACVVCLNLLEFWTSPRPYTRGCTVLHRVCPRLHARLSSRSLFACFRGC